jgi:hypothetical protein
MLANIDSDIVVDAGSKVAGCSIPCGSKPVPVRMRDATAAASRAVRPCPVVLVAAMSPLLARLFLVVDRKLCECPADLATPVPLPLPLPLLHCRCDPEETAAAAPCAAVPIVARWPLNI